MSGAASRVTKLGETELTAYRGDRGKIAYDHSQEEGNPHGLTTADIPDFSAALLAARPGVHPDDEDLFEFVNGNPGDGGSGTPYDFGTFSNPALFTLDMGTF